MPIVCNAVATGKTGRRWQCTDGVKSWYAGTEYRYNGKLVREVYPPNALDTKPTAGTIKEGGWGANNDVKTYKIVNMRDNPALFKVVDSAGVNVATEFVTRLDAQKFIDYKKFVEVGTGTGSPEPPSPSPSPAPIPPATGGEAVSVKGPYPSIGKEIGHTIRGPTTRHYASGKPDDETIEANCKGFDYRNHQFIVYVTMHDIEHDDNISLKLGGTHMGSGWFDQGVSFEAGQCCFGKEEEHPSTQTCVIKGPSIGSLLEKKVGVCATYYADTNFCELFTDTGTGWVKRMEAKDIGGFNPGADQFEAQLRIDGFTKGSVPTIHNAVVQPIAPKNL